MIFDLIEYLSILFSSIVSLGFYLDFVDPSDGSILFWEIIFPVSLFGCAFCGISSIVRRIFVRKFDKIMIPIGIFTFVGFGLLLFHLFPNPHG